jgi:hypothetical protein
VTGSAPRSRRRLPPWSLALAMLVLLVLAALVAGPPGTPGPPLDPASTAPDGLRGVRDLLGSVGVTSEVALEPPHDTSARVFVPVDLLGTERRDALEDWVRRGGTLVVADAASPLHGLEPTGVGLAGILGATPRRAECDLAAVADVAEVVHAAWTGLELPDGDATACFPTGEGEAWLVVRALGEGTVVALGSAEPFTNGQLDRADNAVLAAALLGPAPGGELVVVPRPPVGEGDTGLLDLVAPRVWRGLAVIALGLFLGLLWRGRRLGAPVPERLPPVVPAAELARSVAALLQRAHSREGAAAQLRRHARRETADRLGAAPTTSPDALVHLAVTRTGVAPDVARTALVDDRVGDDAELVTVARASAALRSATGAGPPTGPSPTPRSRLPRPDRADEALGHRSDRP